MANQNDDLVVQPEADKSKKPSREEVKKHAKVLRSAALHNVRAEAEDAPEEVHRHTKTREQARLESLGIETDGFRRKKLTNRQKKALNIRNGKPADDFADFRELNDIKAVFGRSNGQRAPSNHRKIRKGRK